MIVIMAITMMSVIDVTPNNAIINSDYDSDNGNNNGVCHRREAILLASTESSSILAANNMRQC